MAAALSSEGVIPMNLPPNAPKIRITAGLGTANQKTWNLRRPVTLIGASRLAHIVLPKETVSRAHCILINTGHDVLLKDLHSTNGTRCNGQRIDLAVLSDGDVLSLGDTSIQVAIQVLGNSPEETETGNIYHDPRLLPKSVTLQRKDSFEHWPVERAATIIGCRPCVSIQLDHPDVSLVHAALVHVGGELAVFDLTSGTGTWVNHQRCTLAPLKASDSLKIGPFEMVVGGNAAATVASVADTQTKPVPEPLLDRPSEPQQELNTHAGELELREKQLQQERADLEAARAAIENDRRALEQQAMALWKARTQLELERKLFGRRRSGASEWIVPEIGVTSPSPERQQGNQRPTVGVGSSSLVGLDGGSGRET